MCACRDICIYVYKYSYINNKYGCICMHGINESELICIRIIFYAYRCYSFRIF